jgi:hypothetical protein
VCAVPSIATDLLFAISAGVCSSVTVVRISAATVRNVSFWSAANLTMINQLTRVYSSISKRCSNQSTHNINEIHQCYRSCNKFHSFHISSHSTRDVFCLFLYRTARSWLPYVAETCGWRFETKNTLCSTDIPDCIYKIYRATNNAKSTQ